MEKSFLLQSFIKELTVLYSIPVNSASSVWNTYKRRELARQAVKTWWYVSSASSCTAVLGLCPRWGPWALLASPVVELHLISPPLSAQPAVSLWQVMLIATGQTVPAYFGIGKILFVHASRKGSHSRQGSWVPGILLSSPWSGHSSLSFFKSNKDPLNPSSSALWTPHLAYDTPTLQDAILRGRFLALPYHCEN